MTVVALAVFLIIHNSLISIGYKNKEFNILPSSSKLTAVQFKVMLIAGRNESSQAGID